MPRSLVSSIVLVGALFVSPSHRAPVAARAVSTTPIARDAAPRSNPLLEHALPVAERRSLQGRVIARLAAGSYAYLRLREPSGAESWVVSLAATTPEQDQVWAIVLGRADHFHSRRLDRDFEPLLFAAVRGIPE